MDNNTIFITQIGSIVAYIIIVLGLYAMLVRSKDATIQQRDAVIQQKDVAIELLKEKNGWLEDQLKQAKEQAPDVLLKSLNDRVTIMKQELERTLGDSQSKELVVKEVVEKLEQLHQRLQGAIKIADRPIEL